MTDDPDLHIAIETALSYAMGHLTSTPKKARLTLPYTSSAIHGISRNPLPCLPCPDPDFQSLLIATLDSSEYSSHARRALARDMLLNWLKEHGCFVNSLTGEGYYLYYREHRVYKLDSRMWLMWLFSLTGIETTGREFSMFQTACRTAAASLGKRVEVVRFAHYDRENRLLRVSQFNGMVFVLDGKAIHTENNGEGPVVFEDDPLWQAFSPELTAVDEDHLGWLLYLPKWTNRLFSLAFRCWLYSLFFTELCPTRPILVLMGEKGSGKTMTLRLLLRLLFGRYAEVSGVPDKPDAFISAASHMHIYAMDNLDNFSPWLRDKLARIATGGVDHYRMLYTSNELFTVRYRCWMAITSRTPDTLKRDDLADRLLILSVDRIPDERRCAESLYLERVLQIRNYWWGELLHELNRVVEHLHMDLPVPRSKLRMADWEQLGWTIAHALERHDEWERLIKGIKTDQTELLAKNEIIIEALDAWLQKEENNGRTCTARELYNECEEALFHGARPDRDWPRSAAYFARRIRQIREWLEEQYGLEIFLSRGRSQFRFHRR